jgi:hypothetical protein
MSSPAVFGHYVEEEPREPAFVADRRWIGVYNHGGGHPWELGNYLMRRVAEFGGDIEQLVATIMRNTAGYSSIEYGPAYSDSDSDAGLLYSDRGGASHALYCYIFDVARRRLDVFETYAGATGAVHARIAFDQHGATTAPPFVEPPEPYEMLEPTADFEGESEHARSARLAFGYAVETICKEAGLRPALLRQVFERALEMQLSSDGEWSDDMNPVRVVHTAAPEHAVVHQASLGRVRLYYPPGKLNGTVLTLRNARRAYKSWEPGQWKPFERACVSFGVSAQDMRRAVDAGVVAVLMSHYPGGMFECRGDDAFELFQYKRIVANVANAAEEMSLAELRREIPGIDTSDIEEGNELGFLVGRERVAAAGPGPLCAAQDWVSPLLAWVRSARSQVN